MMTKTQQRNYVWDRWGMENNLVAEFCAHTGADPGVARNILQAENWDLHLAVKSYNFLMMGHETVPTSTAYRPLLLNGSTHVPPPPPPIPPLPASLSASTSRPVLQKADAVDFTEGKKLARGISRATDNVNLVSKARSEFALDFRDNNALVNLNQYFIETPVYTFTLPDLTIYPDDFRAFLEKDLIEKSTLASLEQSGRLNWWADSGACQRLWPLATSGDGNCLLHAASLGMWGFHDRLLTLRKALYNFLTNSDCQAALWRRWRWQQTQLNQQAGLVYSELEWQKEWDSIVNMASTAPRKGTTTRRRSMAFDSAFGKQSDDCSENAVYESLEEVHVLALAHVLRRPIIVIADLVLKDINGEALAPIPFGGIYLPLECPPQECHRSPLVLTYDAAHFSALVVMEKESFVDKAPQPPAVIPLTDSEHELLPIQFNIDPGEQFVWGRDEHIPNLASRFTLAQKDRLGLLREYLDVITVPLSPMEAGESGETDLEGSSPVEEEEIERRLSEVDLECDEMSSSSDSGVYKSKAAKQLQSVAKQFGSIGKSMSKRIKKNFGSITKMTRNNSLKKKGNSGGKREAESRKQSQDHILCAVLHTEKRHEYQEEMVRNYLQSARIRFEKDQELRNRQAEERRAKESDTDGPSLCVSPGCSLYGTANTSYLCSGCYAKQKEHINSPLMSRANEAKYGTGRSKFYAESNAEAYQLAAKIPLSRAGSNTDQTLYLSKSTFYNDTESPALSRKAGGGATWDTNFVAQGHVTVVPVNNSSSSSPSNIRRDYAGFKMLDTASSRPCRTPECKFFGCPDTDFYCSKCHKENHLLLRNMNIQEMRI
ncbi:OTU domain-containing protein 7B-like isoform X1 [Neocloeon triangulifer]|uniref:OTU domain-containing protein 7B-like isoform X1 n=2 Tax=Neocloeon triangulifer TaxID=2078957 RepID=UPI00286F6862|nr:OTU domain-containing protein 7B-like isoform X1 [Neocloeon triangulifer]